jgi:hypothetical protein
MNNNRNGFNIDYHILAIGLLIQFIFLSTNLLAEVLVVKTNTIDRLFMDMNFGQSFYWHENHGGEFNLGYQMYYMGLEIGVNKIDAEWGSLITRDNPGSSVLTPENNPNASLFTERKDSDIFQLDLSHIGIQITSPYINKSQPYLLQTRLGFLTGDALDVKRNQHFTVHGMYTEGGAYFPSNLNPNILVSLSLKFVAATLEDRQTSLLKLERLLYIQYTQVSGGIRFLF